jgi:hypothetical protein
MGISLYRQTQAVTFGTALPLPLDCDILSRQIEEACLTVAGAGHKSTPAEPSKDGNADSNGA